MSGAALAIDHGTKRTGFASTDPLRIATRPLEVFEGDGDGQALLERAAHLAREHGADTLVVGLAYNMDGSLGPRAEETLAFMRALMAHLPACRVIPCDERLSTKEAEELLREAGHHGAERRARRDSWSALVLLRDWIEAGEPQTPLPGE
ncbi:MAG: Holliday junction resolvase RuvX [bacterium]|jgi:putative Holliday junction resolvase|nr:Holliday junction resolvase RuvX [Planctomycetota bacterium]HIL52775.1 Holliday junction resolvase RuvX [Planctomycetota bacterium]